MRVVQYLEFVSCEVHVEVGKYPIDGEDRI